MALQIDFAGKKVLITGGASGIGHGIALAMQQAGAEVIVTARTKDSVDACERITAFGELDVRQLDVTNDLSIEECLADLKGLDILVNNAGKIVRGGNELRPENFADVVNANLIGMMRMSYTCLGKLVIAKGSILNIASMTSFFGSAAVPAYAASKAGVENLTKSLAIAWAGQGVRVNAIAPGWIGTKLTEPMKVNEPERYQTIVDRTPMKRWGTADEIGGAAVFLCSDQASFITGTTLKIDGGYAAA
jgi:NAD(P)-dependent dehydrogenase (short-subunit alcohol dehydrogenase family)